MSHPEPTEARAVALQADGKLVLVGGVSAGGRDEWGVIRLGPHGRLDPTFGDRGTLVTGFGPGFDEANAVAVQSNGKLLVAGQDPRRRSAQGRHRRSSASNRAAVTIARSPPVAGP